MPTPPKESIGGFVQSMFETERKQLDVNSDVISDFMNTEEFNSYDEDFKLLVSERLRINEETKSKMDSLNIPASS